MALKSCRECGVKVSTEAKTCPKCGVPNPTFKKIDIKVFNSDIKNLNYFIFIPVLYFSCILFFDYPDIDQDFRWLGHRSIITHSILLPYLILHYKLVRNNAIANILLIGLFLGIGIHLSADLLSKGWRGYALIKFPGGTSIGGLSPVWILINAMLSLYIASKLMLQITQLKKFLYTYLTIGLLVGSLYALDDRHAEAEKLLTFVAMFLITFFYAKKKLGIVFLSKEKNIEKNKENKKRFKGGFWTYLIGTIIVIPIIIFLLLVMFSL